jgi:hypothetical protein
VAVIGGLGLVGHGVTRATVDLDLVTEAAAQDHLVAFLESQGYETLHRSAGYSNHLHENPERGRVDFVYLDDLERDLPTSHEDVVALRRLRASAALSQAEYFRFLSRLPAPPLENLRARKGPRGEPFRL